MPSSRPRYGYGFTDPFALFDSIFGSFHQTFSDPFFTGGFEQSPHQFSRSRTLDPFATLSAFPFGPSMFSDMMEGPGRHSAHVYSQSSRGTVAPGQGWVSESVMTRTVNGVTESVRKRRDANVSLPRFRSCSARKASLLSCVSGP